jgi:hypothetical protein
MAINQTFAYQQLRKSGVAQKKLKNSLCSSKMQRQNLSALPLT